MYNMHLYYYVVAFVDRRAGVPGVSGLFAVAKSVVELRSGVEREPLREPGVEACTTTRPRGGVSPNETDGRRETTRLPA